MRTGDHHGGSSDRDLSPPGVQARPPEPHLSRHDRLRGVAALWPPILHWLTRESTPLPRWTCTASVDFRFDWSEPAREPDLLLRGKHVVDHLRGDELASGAWSRAQRRHGRPHAVSGYYASGPGGIREARP